MDPVAANKQENKHLNISYKSSIHKKRTPYNKNERL